MNGNKFEVGAKVIIRTWSGSARVDTVEKITPSGLIKVCGSLYKPTGETHAVERGSYRRSIDLATDRDLEKLEERKYIQNVFNKMRDVRGMTFEQAKAVAEIFKLNF